MRSGLSDKIGKIGGNLRRLLTKNLQMRKSIQFVVKTAALMVWRLLCDIKSTMYDTDGYMSLPRLILMSSFVALLISVFADLFFGFDKGDNTALLGAMGLGIGGYSLKKFTDKSSDGGKHDKL